MSREPPVTDPVVVLELVPLLVPVLVLPVVVLLSEPPPVVLVPPLVLPDPEWELEELWPPPQLAPCEPRAPVSATTAIPNTATARTWRSFTFEPRWNISVQEGPP
ncbi:hypothetical protein Slala02_47430 [Streptomyces lavendulae subsp. lavendulae]|nr:hypothetical protein Slala01_51500 [Streptomyces lavendulae subsp. lavendulae]GLX28923.1 hypothetical protein Slala02_47430 [Streptomyces lavendulae subsp. lavendulae]